MGIPVVVAPPGRAPVPAGEEAPLVTEGGGVRASVGADPAGAPSVGVEPELEPASDPAGELGLGLEPELGLEPDPDPDPDP